MHSISDKEIDSIRKQLLQVLARLDEIVGKNPEAIEPPETREKMAKRICLGCGIIVGVKEPYTRGLHSACYHTTMRRIRDGIWNESEKIAEGLIAGEFRKPGKPAAIDSRKIDAAMEAVRSAEKRRRKNST